MSVQCIINQPIKVPFTSTGLTTGLTTFSNVTVLVDGNLPLIAPALLYTEIGHGLYTLTITPNVTGVWAIFIEGSIYTIVVVARDVFSILSNLEDDALGSWQWDKTLGTLQSLRQDGSALVSYTVTDTLQSASRERIP